MMSTQNLPTIIFLMGPTASGKTPLAIELVQQLPLEIISVDSAMIYREMDIGTAKPDAEIQSIAPHRLIDILDPIENYSAGQFRRDALREIDDIIAKGRTPLLVGGTMLYFRILQQGIAPLPTANPIIRSELKEKLEKLGSEILHAELMKIDPKAATRIHPNDQQRILRALEVFYTSGKTLSDWQAYATSPLQNYHVQSFALMPQNRASLHERIGLRFQHMLQMGFIDEVKKLYDRGDLSADLASMRSVGYAQIWKYLDNQINYDVMCEQALAATRQLAKRQMTWLRSWQNLQVFDSDEGDLVKKVIKLIEIR